MENLEDAEEANTVLHCSTTQAKMRMVVRSDDSVCLLDNDGLNHIETLLKSKYRAKDMGTLGFEDSNAKSLLSSNRAPRAGTVLGH